MGEVMAGTTSGWRQRKVLPAKCMVSELELFQCHQDTNGAKPVNINPDMEYRIEALFLVPVGIVLVVRTSGKVTWVD